MNNYNSRVMKKAVILLLIIVTLPLARVTAQNTKLENLNAYKVGFFTKKLNLTSQEAEKFWPIYNDYQMQKNKIQLERISIIRNFNQSESSLTDTQLTEMGDKLADGMTEESSMAVTFHKKLKEVLLQLKLYGSIRQKTSIKPSFLTSYETLLLNRDRI